MDIIAYGLAPLSVVAPVASLTIVTNAILANLFFKETLTRMDFVASAIILCGAAAAAATGSKQAADRTLVLLQYNHMYPIFTFRLVVCGMNSLSY